MAATKKSQSTKKLKLKSFVGLFNTIEIKLALKTAIAGALGWAIGSWVSQATQRPHNLISGLWCTLAAIVVLQARLGGTYKAAWIRLSGVILGSFLGALCTILLGSNPLSLGATLFFTVLVCFFLNIDDSIRIACLSVSAVMVLWGLTPSTSPWDFAFFRGVDSLLGILIAVVIARILWPSQATEKLSSNLVQIISNLRTLIFITTRGDSNSTKIDADYLNSKKEIDSLLQDNFVILEEIKIELWGESERLQSFVFIQERLQHLRRVIVTLGKVYPTTKTLIDEKLSNDLIITLNLIDQTLGDLAHIFLKTQSFLKTEELEKAQTDLNHDLALFRKSHITQKFTLTEVENLYVFFYNINAVIRNLLQIVDNLKKTQDLKETS